MDDVDACACGCNRLQGTCAAVNMAADCGVSLAATT